VSEVAGAFIHQNAAVEKRIMRAKKVLAASKRLFDVTAANDFAERLPAVQRALYLLFNEGYHGASAATAVRAELCREAMRLTAVLLEHLLGRSPTTYSIAALMSLHAARLPGRLDLSGHLISLVDQDRMQWDQELISEGLAFLDKSATGAELTEYHLEAAIAAIHARATGMADTDWKTIVSLYDALMTLKSSPILALNRAIALGMCEGPDRGLKELGGMVDRERILAYPFYHAALGDFELRCGRSEIAGEHFRKALALARNAVEREFLDRRANACVSRAQG
jgi:RNA polymerase sigma-70 factor (ECF subfamily)